MSQIKQLLILLALLPVMAGCNKSEPIDPSGPSPDTPRPSVEVIDYSPAPGQFINELPMYERPMTKADMTAAANTAVSQGHVISLGAWGGSVTFRLQDPIFNSDDNAGLRVLGNAITGGAEPGLVYVMEDLNGNGIADDSWLLLAPANFDKATFITVSYHRPDNDAPDERYIRWTASDGTQGYITRQPSFHSQPYFPQWIDDKTITVSGLRLPDNGHFDHSTNRYVLDPVAGTADSYPNRSAESFLFLKNAIDSEGNPASLRQVDFVKVVTGVLQSNGTIGECSTEVSGISLK